MQYTTAMRLLRHLPRSQVTPYNLPRATAFSFATSPSAGAGDPAVHAEDPQGEDAEEAVKAAEVEQNFKDKHKDNKLKPKPLRSFTDKSPPFAPSQKLETHEVTPPDPTYYQKRQFSLALDRSVLDEVPCIGPDGRPLVKQGNDNWDIDQKESEEDNKEYYKHRKPSPLSEVQFVDTRKPITQATDSKASDNSLGFMVEDTVDDSLARAERMFWERARMGIPELPHSQVLARMLRERGQQPHV